MLDGTIAFVAAVFVLAGFTKGVIGMGLPTISMGLLALVMPPLEAAALLMLPSFLTNLWQMLAGPSLKAVSTRLWPMMLGACLGRSQRDGAVRARPTRVRGVDAGPTNQGRSRITSEEQSICLSGLPIGLDA